MHRLRKFTDLLVLIACLVVAVVITRWISPRVGGLPPFAAEAVAVTIAALIALQVMQVAQWWMTRSQKSHSPGALIKAVGGALLDWLRWGVSLAVATWIMMSLPLDWVPRLLRAATTALLTFTFSTLILIAAAWVLVRAAREVR